MSLVMSTSVAIRTFASVAGPQRRKLSKVEVEQIKSVEQPVVTYPLTVTRCKHSKTATEVSNEWAGTGRLQGMYKTPQIMQKHLDNDLCNYLMQAFVDSGEEEAVLIAKWVLWGFAIDDYFDPDDGSFDNDAADRILCDMNVLIRWSFPDDPRFRQNLEANLAGEDAAKRNAILHYVDAKVAIARAYPGTVYDSANDHPLVKGLGDIWIQFAESTPRQYLLRWGINIQRYFNSFFKEVNIRLHDDVPSVHEYILLRRETFAGHCMMMFCEYGERRFLPTGVVETPEMKRLTDAGVDCPAWINDLTSLKKEAVAGDVYNLVIIVAREQKCSYQMALERAWQMFFKRMEDLEKDYELVKRVTAPEYHDGIDMYMKTFKNFIWGGHDWLVSNRRYRL